MTDRTANRQRVVVNEGTWDCSLCTYKNSCVAFRCEMCDSSKGTATRKGKLVVSEPVEDVSRNKRKTQDDYSTDASTTENSDIEDEDFQENKPKPNHLHSNRRIIPNDHLNESLSSSASSSTTIRSYCSASLSSSSKINDHSKATTITSNARSTKLSSSFITNSKRDENENNQKNRTMNKKILVQQKKKKSKFSTLSSMSPSSSTSSTSSSTHITTIITVNGVSVRITELLPNEINSSLIINGNHTSRSSPSII